MIAHKTPKSSHPDAVLLKFTPKKSGKRSCGICNQKFAAKSKFDRFCPVCKEKSELYHFSEWLSAC